LDLAKAKDKELERRWNDEMEKFQFDQALKIIWEKIAESDAFLSEKAPWKMKGKDEIMEVLKPVAKNILNIGRLLLPFLPETAEKIVRQFGEKQIKKEDPLFPRI